jgi:outer membrane biosynthesis protein TonB
MKKLIAVLTIAFIFGVGTAMASSPDSLAVKKNSRSEILAAISYPPFAIELGIEATVYLQVQLLESGEVEVIQAHCSNNEILRYVVDNIRTMNFDPKIYETMVPFNLKFNFNLY